MTYKKDSDFTAITVREDKGTLLRWALNTIGFNKWSDMSEFQPTDYDVYSEYVTLHSDDEVEND